MATQSLHVARSGAKVLPLINRGGDNDALDVFDSEILRLGVQYYGCHGYGARLFAPFFFQGKLRRAHAKY